MARNTSELLRWDVSSHERADDVVHGWGDLKPIPVKRLERFVDPIPHRHFALRLGESRRVPLDFLDGRPLHSEFQRLAQEWRTDTMFSSRLTDVILHPAYLRIIGLGGSAVPLILEELRRSDEPWFTALHALTGVTPEAVEDGDFGTLRSAWLRWGERNGFLSAGMGRLEGTLSNFGFSHLGVE